MKKFASPGCNKFLEGTLFPRIRELVVPATTSCFPDTKIRQ
jgi:hypothetical protein